MRILLVEDDVIQLDVVSKWITSAGYRVTGCSSGEDALRWLDRETFDLVVLDWMMPGLSGHDVLMRIRERGLRIPVMFATACDREFEVASILRLGADDYVVKPLRSLEFLARLEALGRRAGLLAFGAGADGLAVPEGSS